MESSPPDSGPMPPTRCSRRLSVPLLFASKSRSAQVRVSLPLSRSLLVLTIETCSMKFAKESEGGKGAFFKGFVNSI